MKMTAIPLFATLLLTATSTVEAGAHRSIDLSVHPADLFVGLLNPTENDLPFSDEFPYLAEAH